MSSAHQHCRRVIFAGRVQGVGFRYTTMSIARGRPVTGFVRNLTDGTVELFACGDESEVGEFIDEIYRRFEVNIDVDATRAEAITPPEEFAGFEIR